MIEWHTHVAGNRRCMELLPHVEHGAQPLQQQQWCIYSTIWTRTWLRTWPRAFVSWRWLPWDCIGIIAVDVVLVVGKRSWNQLRWCRRRAVILWRNGIMRMFWWRRTRWEQTSSGAFRVCCVNIEHHHVIAVRNILTNKWSLGGKVVLKQFCDGIAL